MILDTVRERPGSSLLISCAGAAVLGFLTGRVVYGKFSSIDPEDELGPSVSLRREYRTTTSSIPDSIGRRITEDSTESRNSGASSPQSSVNGTPRRNLTQELSGELDTLYAIVFRTDLQMTTGRLMKLTAQAAIAHTKQLSKTKNSDFRLWERGNKTKACFQCTDEDALLNLQEAAKEKGVLTFKVKEQFEGGRHSAVLVIGPAKMSIMKELTGSLPQQV